MLRAILAEVAWVLSHMKDNYLSARYHHLARRLGKNKAAMALAHRLLIVIYHVLSTRKPYHELGADYFEQRDRARLTRALCPTIGGFWLYGDARFPRKRLTGQAEIEIFVGIAQRVY
jgi:hypothetical protein